MSTYAIGTSPVQISQQISSPVAIQNTGSVILYLGTDTSVSALSYSLVLNPGANMNWPGNSPLFGVVASGTTTVAILAGAENVTVSTVQAVITGPVTVSGTVNANITNASLTVTGNVNAVITNASIPVTGNVTATISGPVTIASGTVNVGTVSGNITVGGILTPVGIQGGGALIYSGTSTVTPSGIILNLPNQANNQQWYGLKICLILNSGSGVTGLCAFNGSTLNFTKLVNPYAIALASPGTNYFVGNTGRTTTIIPFEGVSYSSYQINLRSLDAANSSVYVEVYGIPTLIPAPTTDIAAVRDVGQDTLINLTTATSYVAFPASNVPYTIRLAFASASPVYGACDYQEYDFGSASWLRVANSIDRIASSGAKPPTSGEWRTFKVPGSGRPARVAFGGVASGTGTVVLTITGD